jgi:hypothetical protein
MATKKARKSTKRLKKSKKLEATKPLKVASGGSNDVPTESVTFNYSKIGIQY